MHVGGAPCGARETWERRHTDHPDRLHRPLAQRLLELGAKAARPLGLGDVERLAAHPADQARARAEERAANDEGEYAAASFADQPGDRAACKGKGEAREHLERRRGQRERRPDAEEAGVREQAEATLELRVGSDGLQYGLRDHNGRGHYFRRPSEPGRCTRRAVDTSTWPRTSTACPFKCSSMSNVCALALVVTA
eukprot:4384823-Prymnesium_polylepis.2